MSDDLKFKDDENGFPKDSGISYRNPDKKAYKTIEELELGETNLKYSLHKLIAGSLIACAGIVLFVFIWHIITPKSWRWLCPNEVESIKNIALTLFGALAMSIATLFYTKK